MRGSGNLGDTGIINFSSHCCFPKFHNDIILIRMLDVSHKAVVSASKISNTCQDHWMGRFCTWQDWEAGDSTIQLSGIIQWTLRRRRVCYPLQCTTPHYARDTRVVENQKKVDWLYCLEGNNTTAAHHGEGATTSSSKVKFNGSYGFEYGKNNAYGPEQAVTLYTGDVLNFVLGVVHRPCTRCSIVNGP